MRQRNPWRFLRGVDLESEDVRWAMWVRKDPEEDVSVGGKEFRYGAREGGGKSGVDLMSDWRVVSADGY